MHDLITKKRNDEKEKEKDKEKDKENEEVEKVKIFHANDVLRKISHAFLGETVHKYYKLPGEYQGEITNELPNSRGEQRRTDGAYFSKRENRKIVISIEDQNSQINQKTLERLNEYCNILQYKTRTPVYSVITTSLPLDKCMDTYSSTETFKYTPHIISFKEFDGEKRLEEARARVIKEEFFDGIQGYDLINIPKMFDENNAEILEEVCELFSKMKMEDQDMKFRLSMALAAVISIYAKTDKDIIRLKEVINMIEVRSDTRQFILESFHEELEEERLKGIQKAEEEKQKGIQKAEEEKLSLARQFAEKIDIEIVAEISGFSKEEILNQEKSKGEKN